MKIDRCVCYDVRFAKLDRVAAATGAATVSELQQHCNFGMRCRLCHPYVRRMLRTGCTSFDAVVTDDDEPERTLSSAAE